MCRVQVPVKHSSATTSLVLMRLNAAYKAANTIQSRLEVGALFGVVVREGGGDASTATGSGLRNRRRGRGWCSSASSGSTSCGSCAINCSHYNIINQKGGGKETRAAARVVSLDEVHLQSKVDGFFFSLCVCVWGGSK